MNSSPFRLLATESLDPSGPLPHWIVPGVRRLGWRAWTLPTREAVGLLGGPMYAELVLRIVEELRPHVLLVHPPYDFLGTAICSRIREQGTRIIGLGHDDALFADIWNEKDHADLRSRFDLWATTSLAGPSVTAGAVPVRWVLDPESVGIDDPRAPEIDIVLLGRHTSEREALACAIAERGTRIGCFGPGWAQPALTRPSRLGVMRRARIVLLPADATTPLFMTEAGRLGCPLLVEEMPGLHRYWNGADGPLRYTHAEDCLSRIFQSESLPPWEHLPEWEEEWPSWIHRMTLADLPERSDSPSLALLYASLFHALCCQGQIGMIRECLNAWESVAPHSPSPLIARARLAFSVQHWQECRDLCEKATPMLIPFVPKVARSQNAFLPSSSVPLQGVAGIDPTLEVQALRLQATVRMGELEKVLDEVHPLPRKRKTALLSALIPDFTCPEYPALVKALSEPDPENRPSSPH